MTTWAKLEAEQPDLAGGVRRRFEAAPHHTIATLRASGAPRLSGTEVNFRNDGLLLSMMGESRKALDLQRDPRFELHSATIDPELRDGDARIGGRAVEVTDASELAAFRAALAAERGEFPAGAFHLFRVDVTALTLVRVGDPADHLVIESWNERRGSQRVERR